MSISRPDHLAAFRDGQPEVGPHPGAFLQGVAPEEVSFTPDQLRWLEERFGPVEQLRKVRAAVDSPILAVAHTAGWSEVLRLISTKVTVNR